MTKAACFENRYVVLGQRPFRVTALLCKLYTLRQAQGAWIMSFFLLYLPLLAFVERLAFEAEGETSPLG